jgi:hypothetical protein
VDERIARSLRRCWLAVGREFVAADTRCYVRSGVRGVMEASAHGRRPLSPTISEVRLGRSPSLSVPSGSSVGRAAGLRQQGPHGLRVCFCPDQENTARLAFDQRGPPRQEARPGRCARQPFLRCEHQGRLGAGGPGAASILSRLTEPQRRELAFQPAPERGTPLAAGRPGWKVPLNRPCGRARAYGG